MDFDQQFVKRFAQTEFEALDVQCANEPMSDYGNARRLIVRFGKDLIFVESVGWLWWDGLRWNEREGAYGAAHLTHMVLHEMEIELLLLQQKPCVDKQRATRFERWARTSGNLRQLRAMLAKAKPDLTKPLHILDRNPWLLSCKNGTVELGLQHEFKRAQRSDWITKQLGVRYVQGAKCPKFESFLMNAVPDVEMRKFLQRVSGYCLTGDRDGTNFFLIVGHEYSGRSVFVRVLREVMGEYAALVPDYFFARKNGTAKSLATTNRRGKRLLASGEDYLGGTLHGRLLAYAHEPMLIERNFGVKAFSYRPTFKLLLPVDIIPQSSGLINAESIFAVPFLGSNIAPKELHELQDVLLTESEGILQWMIKGSEQWFAVGLKAPDGARLRSKKKC